MIHIFAESHSLIKQNDDELTSSHKNFGLEIHARDYSKSGSGKSYSENGNEITVLRIISTFFNLLDWKILRMVGVVRS